MKILVVSSPFKAGFGGGSKRNYFALMNYGKLEDVDATLVIPVREVISSLASERIKGVNSSKYAIDSLNDIAKSGVAIPSLAFELFEDKKILDESSKRSNLPSPFRSVWRDLFSDQLYLNKLRNQVMKKYLQEVGKRLAGLEAVYSQHETHDSLASAHYLSRSTGAKFFALLQLEPEASLDPLPSRGGRISSLPRVLLSKARDRRIKEVLSLAARDSSLAGILSVSAAPLSSPIVKEIVRKYRVDTAVIDPSEAFDQGLTGSTRDRSRENAVYYARLEPSKGVLEIPRIWKIATERGAADAKLYVCGAFSRADVKRKFMALSKKLVGEGIVYLGFLTSEELGRRVSDAKVLVYPSHRDSFSMAILESLACGTPVVAYGIPAVSSVYGGLKAVKIVGEGDEEEMAARTVGFLLSDEAQRRSMFDDKAMRSFLVRYSSWKNVADAEVGCIRSMLKTRSLAGAQAALRKKAH